MEPSTALTRFESPLTTQEDNAEPTVFDCFRAVFQGPWCHSRIIYWIEQKMGRTLLREVQDADRTKKSEDRLLASFFGEPDMDVIRLAIASRNGGNLRTGIRWEIYDDFQLTLLLDTGRFDHIDLIGDMPDEKFAEIAQRGTVSIKTGSEDWDFDGLLFLRRCANCSGPVGRRMLTLYPPEFNCPVCDNIGDHGEILDKTIKRFLKHLRKSDGPQILHASVPQHVENATLLLDVTALPIFCWVYKVKLLGMPLSYYGRTYRPESDNPDYVSWNPDNISWLYKNSAASILHLGVHREAFMRVAETCYAQYEPKKRKVKLEELRTQLRILSSLNDWIRGSDKALQKEHGELFEWQRSLLVKTLQIFVWSIEELVRDLGKNVLTENKSPSKEAS